MSDHHKEHPEYGPMGIFAGYGECDPAMIITDLENEAFSYGECQSRPITFDGGKPLRVIVNEYDARLIYRRGGFDLSRDQAIILIGRDLIANRKPEPDHLPRCDCGSLFEICNYPNCPIGSDHETRKPSRDTSADWFEDHDLAHIKTKPE